MDQGATFSQTIALGNNDIDLSGYTVRGSMRKHFGANNDHDFVCNVVNTTHYLFSLPASNTAAIEAGNYVYDIEIVSGNTVYRVLEGLVYVTPEVTR